MLAPYSWIRALVITFVTGDPSSTLLRLLGSQHSCGLNLAVLAFPPDFPLLAQHACFWLCFLTRNHDLAHRQTDLIKHF